MVTGIIVLIILLVLLGLAGVIVLTYFGVKLSKDGNAVGLVLGFLGLNILGLIITAIIYSNATKK